ncbi:MAG: T9SS type A sorting domain-containing protein [Chitinophagaceae bacterium]|nr:T9SS type A sorting domain-containing protein [Chitinophagaceae bacterium]
MRTYFLLVGILVFSIGQALAQRACFTADYQQRTLHMDPNFAGNVERIEAFIQRQLNQTNSTNGARLQESVIKIPVVVHILYHLPGENISDQRVHQQLEMLNKCFRRTGSDTANTPSIFMSIAADTEIEFQLATSDPRKRSTTGILHKYTAMSEWEANDDMKFSVNTGDDAWDPQSYLNIWVVNLRRTAGYATAPGGSSETDGVVIDYTVMGTNTIPGYEMGKTAVHEIGHWLGLRHLWGDEYCGDDLVFDTPKQANFTAGCPSGTRISCGNSPHGDMYMNYMDYTNDACNNLFTEGQKIRMRTLFTPGGARYSLLSSKGLDAPLIVEIPLPEEAPKWLHPQLYPNPARDELTLDIAYDIRWIGKIITIMNANGQVVLQLQITSRIQVIDVSRLRSGLYFLSAKKEDGKTIKQKFIKL